MRNLGTTSSSFQFINTDEIDEAPRVDELTPLRTAVTAAHGVTETWCCAFAPDCSYFAWSCGGRIVQLIPWDKVKGKLINKDNKKQYSQNENCRNNEIHQHIGQFDNSQGQSFESIRATENNNCNESKESFQLNKTRARRHIDCGGIVWSMAFASGSSSFSIQAMWKRFKFDSNYLILVTGLHNGKLKVWDCNTGNLLMELLDHKNVVRDISFAPNGSLMFASCSLDGTTKLWDLHDDGNMTKTLRAKSHSMFSCSWAPDSKRIAGVGYGNSVIIWNLDCSFSNKNQYMTLRGHNNDIVSCDFSPDSALLATASSDTRIIIWDTFTGDTLFELGHMFPTPRPIFAGGENDHYVKSVCFSQDGDRLTSVCQDGYVRFWSLTDTSDPVSFARHDAATSCKICPRSRITAVG